MIRTILAGLALFSLAACGGGNRRAERFAGTPTVMFATGPIQKACVADGRRAASSARCGCVQAVANQALSGADQRRGARFFKDPHKLQEVRQSDNANNERFWEAWKAFGQAAATVCQGT